MKDDEISYRAREIAAERQQQEQDARVAALARQKELDALNRRVNSFSVEIEALSAKFYTWATRYDITVEQFWSGSRWKSISGWKMAENTIHGDFASTSYKSTTWQCIVTTKGK